MKTYTIELSDLEVKGLNYVAYDANDWIQNAIKERCRLAIDELVQDEIRYRLTNGLPIQGTREEIAASSTLPNGRERNDAAIASIQQMNNQNISET